METYAEIWSIFLARGEHASYSAVTIFWPRFHLIYNNCFFVYKTVV